MLWEQRAFVGYPATGAVRAYDADGVPYGPAVTNLTASFSHVPDTLAS